VVVGAADTAFAYRNARPRGQYNIDQRDLFQLGEDLARFVAEAGALTPLAQRFPEHIGQKANRMWACTRSSFWCQTGLITKSPL